MKNDFYDYFNLCLLEDKLPHAFLIEVENIEEEFLKILENLYYNKLIQTLDYINNLNLIIIEPDGKEIKSDSITNLQKRFMFKPANNKYNIYIIKNAEKMNVSSANKLLKFLEEPLSSTIGILLSSSSQVIPTIKSRCQQFKVSESEFISIDEKEIDNIINMLSNIDIESELEFKKKYSKMERYELINLFNNIIRRYSDIINGDIKSIENQSKNILIIDKILRLLKSNVNIDLVLDKLCIEVKN